STNLHNLVIISKFNSTNFVPINKKNNNMFNDFDYDNYVTESTDEGFYRAYNEMSGQSAEGGSSDEAISNLAEEENNFFFNEEFGSFDS
ncbi:MAG: hypothetical protein WCR53_04750, partial [Bacteroidaceae bacterium]